MRRKALRAEDYPRERPGKLIGRDDPTRVPGAYVTNRSKAEADEDRSRLECDACGKFVRLNRAGNLQAHQSRRGISCPGGQSSNLAKRDGGTGTH